ncbi:AMP-binding protein [Burkholderia sp. IMCC1007]|uniref:AMP-binding protein n=1 Tax=Burkholderia sp. IMCC1007 TaxID=3004104 RepID=UPI0022B4EA53|nr:AMP-binding protein [Burkholderia sp. IMCC1007]
MMETGDAGRRGLSWWPADTSEPVLDMSVGDALRQAASRSGDSVALIEGLTTGGRRSWSYAELWAESCGVASALLQRFRPGEHVALWAPNCPEWVHIEFGAALAGITLVTVNPAYLANELSYVLAQSKAAGIIAVDEYRGRALLPIIDEVRRSLPLLREVVSLGQWREFLLPGSDKLELPHVDPDAIAQIQYTSGTTGFPKGVMLTHCGLVNNGKWFAGAIGARDGDVWVNPMRMFHTAGCVLATLGALQTGGALVLPLGFDASLLLDLVESERGSIVICVPTMMIRMLEQQQLAPRDVSSWRLAVMGGAPVPPELVHRAAEQLGAAIGIGFGQTEASPYITHTRPSDTREDWYLTVGRPLPQVEVKVVSPESEVTVETGVVGEIWTRSCCVMKGYFENEEATRTALTADGWLRTGDLGSMEPDGYIRVQGRMKEMIIRGGENIYPREIEDVLIQHSGISTASVIGLPDKEWGEVVAAFVQLRPGAVETGESLTAYCREHLASFKVPRIWRFVDQFPQTPSGKIRKVELRDAYLKGTYDR